MKWTFSPLGEEAIDHCPNPGETGEDGRFYVRATDMTIPVQPPVEVQTVDFQGCGQLRAVFNEFPVDSAAAEVNIDGSWESVTIEADDLTTIPGQYGDSPLFRYSADGGKLIGFEIVGKSYENRNRCAENV